MIVDLLFPNGAGLRHRLFSLRVRQARERGREGAVKAAIAGALLCGLSGVAVAQVSSGGAAVRSAPDWSTTVSAHGVEALSDAVEALNRARGWVVDYEGPVGSGDRDAAGQVEMQSQVLHLPAVRDAASSEEKRALEEMVRVHRDAYPGQRLRVEQTGARRFDLVSEVQGSFRCSIPRYCSTPGVALLTRQWKRFCRRSGGSMALRSDTAALLTTAWRTRR